MPNYFSPRSPAGWLTLHSIFEWLRFWLLFPFYFLSAFVLMLPALVESRVPVWYWPFAVAYAMFSGARAAW